MFEYVLAIHGWPIGEECVVLRQSRERASERFDYRSNRWVRDEEAWWRHVMNDNSYDDITEAEAMAIISKFGGDFNAVEG